MTDLRNLKIETFSADGLDALVTAAESFFAEGGRETDQARLIDWRYEIDSGTHHLVILYTE